MVDDFRSNETGRVYDRRSITILASRVKLLTAQRCGTAGVSFINDFANARRRVDRNANVVNDRLAKQAYTSHFKALYYGNISSKQHLSLIIVTMFA